MRLSKALVAPALLATALISHPSAQAPGARRFVEGEILVKFRPDVDANARADAHRAAGAGQVSAIQRTGLQRVRVPARSEAAAIAVYRSDPNVLYAEPNFIRRFPALLSSGEGQAVPGDYYFDEQWGLHNTGQQFYCIPWIVGELCFYVGTPDADMDAPETWAITEGSATVSVAVIDSGVDYTNPDLAPNYAGGDDFVFGDGDPMDDHGHGTHVAGTIAAAMNNRTGTPPAEEGVAGVAPHARILAYKVCRSDGTCDDFAIQQAIARAITDGANVINMSLGETEYSQSLDEAVQDAWNAGLVIVAGAGNNGSPQPFYPAALDNVISVAAFDENHLRPSFSNYGSWVDISAPGNAIMSTYPMAACGITTTPGDTGCYTWNTGTSMATPHVSGAAALVWSRGDVTGNSQVVDILLNSADRQGVSGVRLDSWTIHGGLNLHDAFVHGLVNLPPHADAGADQLVMDDNADGTELVNLDATASSDPDGNIVTYEWFEGTTTIGTGATPAVGLPVGTHTLILEVTDDSGNRAADSVVVTVNPANEVSVTASTSQATEAGPTDGVFTVTRTGGASAPPLIVQYAVGGTAVAGTDYTSLAGTVTIEAGSSTATVAVKPTDDAAYETNETVILTLTANAAYRLGSPTAATVTIVSDDLPPDLVVSSMAAPAISGADLDIVVTDATKNQGTGRSPASQTGFYLSPNSTWDAADVFLGSRQLSSLDPGVTSSTSTTIHVPPSTAAGAYYVIAKADRDNAVTESTETNNTRASAIIKIGPDLVVSALTAPATLAAGDTFSVSETTKNQGGGGASASTTRFYLSTNGSVDASDVILGSRTIGALAPGTVDSASPQLTLPANTATGTYYIIAQADTQQVVTEATETNNTKSSSAVKIGPDLVLTAVSVPSSAAPGGTISASDTTKNQGAGGAAASTTGFYLSTNTSVGAGDVLIGSRQVGGLGPNGTTTASTTMQIPANTPAGSYYVVGKADLNAGVAETSETNNERASAAIRIGGDLVVTAITASSPARANGPILLSDTTKNQGTVPVPESSTAFYLSSNANYDANDAFLGSRLVGPLDPSAVSSASNELIVPSGTPAGNYYVFAVADFSGTVAESLESNNIRNSLIVRIGPDLTVPALTAPSSAVAGTSITATDTTRNQGADTAPPSSTSFYLSTNASHGAGDLLLGTRQVSSLAAGAGETGSASLPIPASTAAGTYYLIAVADGDGAVAESLENNNGRMKLISISAAP